MNITHETMVERVAKAIQAEDRAIPPDGETDDGLMRRYARAAIAAIDAALKEGE